MMSKSFLMICLAMAALVNAPGFAQAQAPAGNVTVVTIIDVLSNANVAFQPRLGGPFDERIYIDLK